MGSLGKGSVNTSRFLTREEMNEVRNILNHRLPSNAESATLLSVENVDNQGYADVEYELNFRIPYTEVDSDGISHTMYDTESEVRKERMKVR